MPRVKYHESARREALSRQQSAGASAQRAHAAEHGTMWHYTTGVLTQTSLGDWALVFAGILLLLYIVGTWNYDYFRKQGIPSTSPKVPFVGDMIGMFMNKSFPEIVKQQYKRAQDHGVYGSFQFVYPVFTVVDPELIKVVAVKEFDNFMNHQTVQTEKSDPVFSKNLFNLKDQAWRDMRATLSPAFTTSKIKGMFPLISKCGEQMVRHLRQKYADSKEGALKEPLPTDMKDLFTRLANDVIATAAFGVSCDSMKDPDNDFYRWGKVMTTFSQWRKFVFLGYILIPKLMQALRLRVLDGEATDFFFSLVNGTLKERRQKGIFRPDMLQLLMQAREGQLKADKEDAAEAEDVGARKKNMTDDDICAQAGIFFLAGFETVSTALCLTAHLLAHHDDVQKRLYAEISQVMEEVEGNASYESVQGMKYLDAVINESLRLYPPAVATERVCQRDTQLPAGAKSRPVTVRKGQAVSIPITGLHYDAEYWPDPEKFDPERFSDENKHNIKPFTYMPFGVGPRFCIGQRFSLMEVKLALVHLLSNFELTPCPKTKHPLEFTASFNLMAKGGFWCGLTPRDL